MPAESRCIWTYDGHEGGWFTECGEAWEFTNDGTPSENKYKYCPWCGEVVVEYAPTEEE